MCVPTRADKLCIHQTDDRLKTEGINALGLFVRVSRTFHLLWSPEFFSRTFCCLEVAAFLQAKREMEASASTSNGRAGSSTYIMAIHPVQFYSALAFSYVAMTLLAPIPSLVALLQLGPGIGAVSMIACLCVVLLILARNCQTMANYVWARDELNDQLRAFSFHDSQCAEEEDKVLIGHLLTHWYRTAGDRERAIELFDRDVRTHVRELVNQRFGPIWPWLATFNLSVLATLPAYCDTVVARAQVPLKPDETRALDMTVWTFWAIAYVFLFWPTCCKLLVQMTSLLLPRRTQGWHISAVGLVVGIPSLAIFLIRNLLLLRVRAGFNIVLILMIDVVVIASTWGLDLHLEVRRSRAQ